MLKTSVSLFPESVGSQRDCLLSSNSRRGQVGREVCSARQAHLVRIPDSRVAGRYAYLHYNGKGCSDLGVAAVGVAAGIFNPFKTFMQV